MNILMIAIGVGLSVVFFVIILILSKPSRQSELLVEVTSQAFTAEAEGAAPKQQRVSAETLIKPFGAVRRLVGGPTSPQVARRLMLAGYRRPYHADAFLAAKLLLPAMAGLATAFFIHNSVILWFAISVFLAFFAPDFWLTHAINKRFLDLQRLYCRYRGSLRYIQLFQPLKIRRGMAI